MSELKPALAEAVVIDDVELPATTVSCGVVRVNRDGRAEASDEVIEEVPVALVYNGVSHAVMLASPADLEDFALGFSLSEGILSRPGELYDIEIVPGCSGISIEMDIASERFVQLKDRRRQLAGRTGCGLCGVDSLAAVTAMPAQKPAHDEYQLEIGAIQEALRQLPHWQAMRQQCGAAHAAAWADAQGNILCLREDVGRHNALDKLVGALARENRGRDGFVLVTSRASYEMVQKVASAGLPALVAVSAPTALAVRQAQAAGLLLVGFARSHGLVVYSGAGRLRGDSMTALAATLM